MEDIVSFGLSGFSSSNGLGAEVGNEYGVASTLGGPEQRGTEHLEHPGDRVSGPNQ